MNPVMHCRRGFTLVELFIGVVFVLILVGALANGVDLVRNSDKYTKIRLYHEHAESSTIYVKSYTVDGSCIKYIDRYNNPGQFCGNYEFKTNGW